MCRDSCMVPGAAPTEIELARRLKEFSLKETGFFALKYAADATCTVLRVDQIIMAKPAGGTRREQPAAGMDED
ncbi:T-complex protein 1 subunit theta [Camellia lanceoleosa]|uniref:T-complex protein 1 subunit theta n=1 Tax=Camellia lanceoleosa TaxID=1840588 RepID=A0ACC0IQJ5_9ERIC|nr:T-complex protein 1 subunit theta [Camellia lanceoleosa]